MAAFGDPEVMAALQDGTVSVLMFSYFGYNYFKFSYLGIFLAFHIIFILD